MNYRDTETTIEIKKALLERYQEPNWYKKRKTTGPAIKLIPLSCTRNESFDEIVL
jgi:hypothetical protein